MNKFFSIILLCVFVTSMQAADSAPFKLCFSSQRTRNLLIVSHFVVMQAEAKNFFHADLFFAEKLLSSGEASRDFVEYLFEMFETPPSVQKKISFALRRLVATASGIKEKLNELRVALCERPICLYINGMDEAREIRPKNLVEIVNHFYEATKQEIENITSIFT